MKILTGWLQNTSDKA